MKNIKGFNQFLNEDGSTTAVVGSGTAVSGPSFSSVSVAGVSIDGGHSTQGSSGVSTLGNVSGMGDVVSAQPSDTPGDVAGSTKGSGDIGQTLKPFTKSFPNTRKKKKEKKKKTNSEKGAQIDKFYTSKYSEKYIKSGNVIQDWKTFNKEKNGNKKV